MSLRRPSPQIARVIARVAPASRPALRVVRARNESRQEMGPLPLPTLPPRRSGVAVRAIPAANSYEPDWHEAPDTGPEEDVATLRQTRGARVPPPDSSEDVLIDFQSDEYVSGTSTSIWNERGSYEASGDDIFDMDELGVQESRTSRDRLPAASSFAEAEEDGLFGNESAEEEEFWLSRSREAVAASGEIDVTKHASVEAMRKARVSADAPRNFAVSGSTMLPAPLARPAPFPIIPMAERAAWSSRPPAAVRGEVKKVRREGTSVTVLRGLVWFVVGTTIGLLGAEYLQRSFSVNHAPSPPPAIPAPAHAAVRPAPVVHAPLASAPAVVVARTEATPKVNSKVESKVNASVPAIDVNRLPKAPRFSKPRAPAAAIATTHGPHPLTKAERPSASEFPGAEAIPDLDALLTQTLGGSK